MARIELPAGDDLEQYRLLGLQPDMGHVMATLADAIYNKSTLDVRVREAVRMKVAQLNQCQICLNFRFPELQAVGIDEAFYEAVGDWQNGDFFSEAEQLALEYTERFMQQHMDIDDEFFSRLKTHYSAADIFELSMTVAGLMANGRVMQVLQIDQACAI